MWLVAASPTLHTQVDSARLRLLARLMPAPADTSQQTDTPPAAAAASSDVLDPSAGQHEGPAAAAAAAAEPLQTSPLLDGLVSKQPLLLVANVDDLLDELSR
jgi:hypothetical protein